MTWCGLLNYFVRLSTAECCPLSPFVPSTIKIFSRPATGRPWAHRSSKTFDLPKTSKEWCPEVVFRYDEIVRASFAEQVIQYFSSLQTKSYSKCSQNKLLLCNQISKHFLGFPWKKERNLRGIKWWIIREWGLRTGFLITNWILTFSLDIRACQE